MNIFILDKDPQKAAKMLCDKHLIKMILESAQLLCSPFEPGVAPYKRTHYNHPCAKWIRDSKANYQWLGSHAMAMAAEYKDFFCRRHKSQDVIEWCIRNISLLPLPNGGMTPFAKAMPEQYKKDDAVEAYRAYYLGEKASFAKWTRGRKIPDWWEFD